MRKLELLIPAGSLDVLKTAVLYGADAVYLGGEAFGLRAKAKNFTNEEIKEGIAFAPWMKLSISISSGICSRISRISFKDSSRAVTTRFAPCLYQKRNVP